MSKTGSSEPRPVVAEQAGSGVGLSDLLRALTEQGSPVRMRVHGLSMMPFIRDDDVVTIAPLAGRDPSVGEVVAFTSPDGGKLALHRVIARAEAGWLLRGDNRGESDGIVPGEHILGSVTRVERLGRDVAFGTRIGGTGIAWLSGKGGVRGLMVSLRRARQVGSSVLLRAQGLPLYRVAAQRLLGRVEVEEAGQADTLTFRLRNCTPEKGPQPLEAHGRTVSTWVAKRRGRIVGLADLVDVEEPGSPWAGQWLSSLAVRVRYRGRGAGEELASRVIAKAISRDDPFLSLIVREDNAAALGLFKKLGFAPLVAGSPELGFDVAQQPVRGRPVVMRKSLAMWAEDSSLSAELRTLLLCARAVLEPGRSPAFYAALSGCSDAGLLCEAAIDHGMVGHLYNVVANSPAFERPPSLELLEQLTGLQRVARQRSLRQTAHLLRVVDELHAAGIEVMPYKGPVWAQRLYGDVSLRAWEDLDLIARHKELPRLREVLLEQGFVDASSFHSRVMSRRRRGWGEIAFRTRDSTLYLDVHWCVTVGFSAGSLTAERLFARPETICLLDHEVVSPSEVDALIISCINGTKDRWNSVEGLLGIGVQVLRSPAALWIDVLDSARAAGCRRRVIIGVAHACRVLGLEVPAEVARAVGRDAVAKALLGSLAPGTLDRGGSASARTELARLTWRFATEDSIAAAVWHAATRFFRPGPEDWDWLSVPPGMSWLYRLLRPARLAAKWARRL